MDNCLLNDLALVAYCNFCGALLATVPTVLTGLLAWQWELDGRRLKGILLHLLSGYASLVLIASVWWVHWKFKRGTRDKPPASRWVLEVLAVAVVAMTGHLAGFLSGVNHP